VPNEEWQAEAEKTIAAAREGGNLEPFPIPCSQAQKDVVITVLGRLILPMRTLAQAQWPSANFHMGAIRMPLSEFLRTGKAMFQENDPRLADLVKIEDEPLIV
jgi:hypothetical protein